MEKEPIKFVERPSPAQIDTTGKENTASDGSKDNVELEYPLSKLVAYVKKQGYPIEGSFVSFYSANFQAQINCGPEPTSPAIMIKYADLDYSERTKQLTL